MKPRRNQSTSSNGSSAPAAGKLIVFFLKLGVSSLALALVFSRVDGGTMLRMLGEIGPFRFLAAALIYILSQLVSSVRWKLLLPEHFTLRRLFSIYMIGAFFGSFLPGILGGDAFRAYYLNKTARKLSLTLSSIFMDRYVGYFSLMLIGIAAFPFSLRYLGDSPYRWTMPAIFAAFMFGSLLFFGFRLGRLFTGLSAFYDYYRDLKTRKPAFLMVLVLSFSVQLMNFLMVMILASGLGQDIPVLLLFVFLPIIITVTTIPISISGLGLREGSFVLLLGLIGIRPESATSLSLAWFFSVLIGSLPGIVVYMTYSRERAQP